MESSILSLPKRPQGTYHQKFKQRELTSNHFKVNLANLENIYLFRVNFEPKLDEQDRLRRNAIYMHCNTKISEVVHKPVFSGSIIYTTQKPSWGTDKSIEVQFNNTKMKILLKLVKSVNFKTNNLENQTAQLSFLNNYLRTAMRKLNFVEIGKSRKFFDPKTKKCVPDTNFFIYQGFTANFCRLEGGLYLKVDSASKIVNSKTVLEEIGDMYHKYKHLPTKEEKREKVQEAFRGATVMANYGSSQYWIIDKIVFDGEGTQFYVEELQETLSSYYQRKYGLTIQNKKQPLIQTRNKQNEVVLLIPQLCLLTGISDDVDQRKRREISKLTNVKTFEKVNRIMGFRKKLRQNLKQISPLQLKNNLGIAISDDLAKVTSKEACNPTLKLGGSDQIPEHQVSSFQLFNKQIYNSSVSIDCCLIHFQNFHTKDMEDIICKTAKNLSVDIKIEKRTLNSVRNSDVVDTLSREIENCSSKKTYNMFLIVLPTACKAYYKDIKQLCVTKLQVLSQIVLDNFNNKKGPSVGTKVLLQMIAKVGNILWTPISKVTKQHETIFVGINSYSAKNTRGMKRVGFCATMNQDMTKFYSDTWLQGSESSAINCYDKIMVTIAKQYHKHNKTTPQEIVILRDGCSASQIKGIREFQVQQCVDALKKIQAKINLTFVVVDKKPTQKFLSSNQNEYCNPNAGTIINSQLVSEDYEFFLISQKSNMGTTVPTFYKVLYCDSQMEAGMLEELLYTQCFNYANWTGSIKIPSPIQYAKKICEFMGTHMKEEIVDKLQNNLYYI